MVNVLNKALKAVKSSEWVKSGESIESTKEAAKLLKILSKTY